MKKQNNKELVVVKVGTNVLTDRSGERDRLDTASFHNIGSEIRDMSDNGTGVVLVSSGAITAGILGEKRRREDIADTRELQRYAARGWDNVVQEWKRSIGPERVTPALLTKHELQQKSTKEQMLGVLGVSMAYGDVFVVNENDTISDEEIKFGDNDTLAASLAATIATSGLYKRVRLALLTNIDGLRTDKDDPSSLVRTVTNIDDVEHFANDTNDFHSRGGMVTKLRAARIAKSAGVETAIGSGRLHQPVTKALTRQTGTYFELPEAA